MRRSRRGWHGAPPGIPLPNAAALAQEPPPRRRPPTPAAPTPEPASRSEPRSYRPIEGNVIINLPSVDVPEQGTLTLLFTHRFRNPSRTAASTPLLVRLRRRTSGSASGTRRSRTSTFAFYRSSDANATYEIAAKYGLLSAGAFARLARRRRRLRTAPRPGQPQHVLRAGDPGVLAGFVAPHHRGADVPQPTSGQPELRGHPFPTPASTTVVVQPEPFYANVFNVPIAASVAITHSITLHGEVVPSYAHGSGPQNAGRPDSGACPTVPRSSPGVGWSVSSRSRSCGTASPSRRQPARDAPWTSTCCPTSPAGAERRTGSSEERLPRLQPAPGACEPRRQLRGRIACATMAPHARPSRARRPALGADRPARRAPAGLPERRPHGRRPRLSTALRVGLRGADLCVRFDGRDDGVVATYTERDDPLWEEDVFEVFLSPEEPARALLRVRGQSARHALRRRASLARSRARDDARRDGAGTARDSRARDAATRGRWSASLRIPLARALRRAAAGRAGARTSTGSIAAPPDEYSAWSPTLAEPPDFHVPERFGMLDVPPVEAELARSGLSRSPAPRATRRRAPSPGAP